MCNPDNKYGRAIIVACLMASGILLAGCGKGGQKEAAGGEPPEPATPVTVEPALRGAIDHVVMADAVLYPINQANVVPKITAPVKRILVNRGDHVRVGQVLAELESGDLASAAQESKHQYEQTQAAYQTMTGATAVEVKGKAESDVQAAQQALDAA
jgi:multidrug efflux pump subunit AcrA (membrane-fusion protein)